MSNKKQLIVQRLKTWQKIKKNTVKIFCMISIITVQTTNISHQSTRQHSDSIWTWLRHQLDISSTSSKNHSVVTTSFQTKHNQRSSRRYGVYSKPLLMPCEAVTKPQKTTDHHLPKGQPMMTQRWKNIILQLWLWRKRQGQTMVKQWIWQKNKFGVQRLLIWQKRQKQNENKLHDEQHPNTHPKRLP